ncbi:hypothetical protein CRT60_14635 [Azospirillum palustre]|uniref:Uncharacterized protein n=1 Tax=Azospirillum palustre TaxID=2044885 RepID=A0A2B8BE59_9PROT|nr:hypothetical protein [Azospirillum palustre]PGH56195.1 hypothetical protein CRT60_14635 [Azospirillum palustre]
MPLDSRSFTNDQFPRWAEEPPTPSESSLVPGSQFHEEQWIMAAGMLARGNSFLQVSRAMGCSRTTLWRAYYGSKDFRHRVWWERQALNREAELRLSSLRVLVAEQIERLVTSGDPATVRWLAERLGLFAGLDLPAAKRQDAQPDRRSAGHAAPPPAAEAAAGPAAHPAPRPAPKPEDPPAVTVPELDDDDIPGAIRERHPPSPAMIAAVVAQPEAAGPKGVFPYTLNQYEEYPNLNPGPVGRRAAGAFSWRR